MPPSELSTSSHINWFDAQRQVEALQYLRQEVTKNTDPRLAAMIVGFPRFSRFEDVGLHVQASGSIAIWAVLQQITEPPAIIGEPPQVIMEIDPPSLDNLPNDTPELFHLVAKQYSKLLEADDNVLGGYSGGPLMYFCPNGSFLIGIMKQASVRLEVAFATPIDVFVNEVRKAGSCVSEDR